MLRTKILVPFFLAGIPACTTFTPAPGADQVRVTNRGADVAGCTPVGNIKVPKDQIALFGNQPELLKNQVIGLGGNVAFVTEGTLRYPEVGIAYRCPKAGTR